MLNLKKVTQVLSIIAMIWILATLLAILTLPSSSPSLLRGDSIQFFANSTYSYPIPPVSSYCESWKPSHSKVYWSDFPSAYASKKVQEYGWKRLSDKDSGIGLSFAEGNTLNYSSMVWTKLNKVKDQENSQLFLVPDKANWIFTRMYTFKDSQGQNLQTARLGVDYACDKQLFNHVPGASAFCRKDYLQLYLIDYNRRYNSLGLGSCYTSITPQSFLLQEPEHCVLFMKELEVLLNRYNETNMPIQWITKSALRHKGYGIELLDYSLAKYFYTLYSSDYASCSNILPTHQQLIVQRYINNPALIEGRKFDFRVFVMCINSDPLVVGWAPDNGHTRLSDQLFDEMSTDFTTHITANVANSSPEALEFLKKYRFNLREIGEYFQEQIGDVDAWIKDIAYPKIKKILIHRFRATQQNFLVKRTGLFEFYGVDFIMDNSYKEFYLLESNRRPDVQEKNPDLQYREDMIVKDMVSVADYFMENDVNLKDTELLFSKLQAFIPLIDETKEDPYFEVIENDCAVIFKEFNDDLPIDPMIEPLKFYIDNY